MICCKIYVKNRNILNLIVFHFFWPIKTGKFLVNFMRRCSKSKVSGPYNPNQWRRGTFILKNIITIKSTTTGTHWHSFSHLIIAFLLLTLSLSLSPLFVSDCDSLAHTSPSSGGSGSLCNFTKLYAHFPNFTSSGIHYKYPYPNFCVRYGHSLPNLRKYIKFSLFFYKITKN